MQLPAGLSDIRKKRHITPAHVAGFIGVSVETYWDLEIGLADDLICHASKVNSITFS